MGITLPSQVALTRRVDAGVENLDSEVYVCIKEISVHFLTRHK